MRGWKIGFRGRLAFIFVLLAIVPLAVLTLVYLRYLTGTIEYWQNPGIERSLENSLAVAREGLERYREDAEAAGGFLVLQLDPGWDAATTSRFLGETAAQVGADAAALYRRTGGAWTRWAAGGPGFAPDALDSAWAAGALLGHDPPLDLSSPSVLGVVAAPAFGPDALLVVGLRPPEQLVDRVRTLAGDVDLYRRLAGYERIQTVSIVAATVAVVALVIIAALIVARLLARSVSRPILELVEATRRLSSGDLDHPVDVKARDEIALLVRSFNRMTEDLRASKENLRRAERTAAWRDVARRIAHEIKNPLTPVQLSVHRLRKRMTSTDPDSQRVITECLDLIHDEVANLRRLADEFSGFARMPPPQPVLSDLGELSRSVLDLYAGSNPRVEVGVEVRRGPVEARVDPGQYRQALGNLVKNALEVMPDGGRLRVSVERVLPPERPGARVSVTDTGPGLPVEVRGRVFEPYVTTKRGGSGLGLAIVHRIASDHGGSVDVETAEGRGTTFRLFFPESGGAAGAS